MALYNNPYQYSFGVPGQMNQFQQQPVQMPAQPVQQPQHRSRHIRFLIRTHITDADVTLDAIADNFISRVSFD